MATGRATERLTLNYLFENIAARTFEIDEDDVGIDRPDPVKQLRRVVDPPTLVCPAARKPSSMMAARNGFLVDDGNAQIPAQRNSMGFMDAFLHVAGQGMIFAVVRPAPVWRLVSALHHCRKVAPAFAENDAELKGLGKITPGCRRHLA